MVQPKNFKHILAAVDPSPQGQMALQNAIHQAKEDKAKLTLVSIFEQGSMSTFDALDLGAVESEQDRVLKALAKWQKAAEDQNVTNVDTAYAEGNKVGEVIVNDIIPKIKPDLIVMGAHSKDAESHWFGSQSSYVAKNAPVSVLVVR